MESEASVWWPSCGWWGVAAGLCLRVPDGLSLGASVGGESLPPLVGGSGAPRCSLRVSSGWSLFFGGAGSAYPFKNRRLCRVAS